MADNAQQIELFGRLLLLQSTVHIMPDIGTMGAFICRGLRSFPGIESVGVHAVDTLLEPNQECSKSCLGCSPTRLDDEFSCHIPIKTIHNCYGLFHFKVTSPEFSFWKPHLKNLANVMATIIENRNFNTKLQHLVRERTEQLEKELIERSKAEESRRESEELFRQAFENANIGMTLVGLDGRHLRVNPALCKMFGYRQEDFEGMTVQDTTYPEDLAVSRDFITRALAGEISHARFEKRHVHQDGHTVWVQVASSLIRDPHGQPLYFISHVQDISARRQAEEERDRLFNHSLDMLCIAGFDGFFKQVNPAGEKLLGWTDQELLRKPWIEFVHPEDRAATIAAGERLAAGEAVDAFENRYQCREGFYRWISWNAFPMLEEGLIFCVGRDVTKHKRAEELVSLNYNALYVTTQQLEQSRNMLQLIIESVPIRIFWKDSDLRYLGCNTLFARDAGFSHPQQLLGQDDFAMSWREQAEAYRTDDRQVIESGRPKMNIVEQQTTPAGDTIWLNTSKVPLQMPNSETFGVLGVCEDITDRKKAEGERLQFSKLESLGTLAGGIAHDFNNILTAILGNIGLALLENQIGPQVRQRLARAEQACLRAQALSMQLLTFAKGGVPIKKIISIANLLKESANLTLSGSTSRCEFSIPEDLWSVEADEGQISQVFSNLLLNADQAMPEGGVIKIRAENFMVERKSELPLSRGKYLKLTFTDQGVGISPQYLDKIFDPYFSTKQKGSGLGLATAYAIIQNHFGHTKVESQIGVGTTFTVYLPALEAEIFVDEQETISLSMGHERVLVMDDEEMVREVIGRMLDHLGYEADFASDGAQAIEEFARAKEAGRPFVAVILDLTIPGGMGGKETIKKLLEIDPQVKAIVSSGYSDDVIMADFKKYGFCAVIAKPYKISELSKTLHKVIVDKI
jgi:PAS domain S-box-containing protein